MEVAGLTVGGAGVVLAVISLVVGIRNQRATNDLQAKVVGIEEDRRAEELELARTADVRLRVVPTTPPDGFLELLNRGPAPATAVSFELRACVGEDSGLWQVMTGPGALPLDVLLPDDYRQFALTPVRGDCQEVIAALRWTDHRGMHDDEVRLRRLD